MKNEILTMAIYRWPQKGQITCLKLRLTDRSKDSLMLKSPKAAEK